MIRRRSLSIVLILAVLLPGRLAAQSAGPTAAVSEAWAGKYSNAALQFELKPTPFGGLSGVLTFNRKLYLATARAEGDKLTGSFRSGADAFPYEATRKGNELRFVTGGTEYLLRREGAAASAPSNPLARGGAAPLSSPLASVTGELVQTSLGYSFRLPTGWTSKESTDGVMLLPGGVSFDPNRVDNSEVYLLALRDDYDPREESQVVQQLSSAVAKSGGRGGERQAMIFGPRPGASYCWDLRDPKSDGVTAFDIHLATEGRRAFVMIAAGEKTRVRSNDISVHQILSSMAFAAAKTAETGGPLADATPLAQRWLNKLRGKLVRQFWASQGMSSDKRHWLNADGTYAFKSSSMVSVDVSGASALSTGRDDSTGRWSIRDVSGKVFLEVRYNNGNIRRMPITEDNRNWFLNGEKAFAVDPE